MRTDWRKEDRHDPPYQLYVILWDGKKAVNGKQVRIWKVTIMVDIFYSTVEI
jgi:hypothetical protein